jgi:hypothetical protein
MINKEYNAYKIMLKNAYITMSVLEKKAVASQIRQIYKLLEIQFENNNKLYKRHMKCIKQYLHNMKTYDQKIIYSYGKIVIGILE